MPLSTTLIIDAEADGPLRRFTDAEGLTHLSGSAALLMIVAVSVSTRPSGVTSWIVSGESLVTLSGKMRWRSPISSGFKLHSASPSGRPFDNLLPGGSPLITILLDAGIPSVPSIVIGKLISSPTIASTTDGADRTGVATGNGSSMEVLLADSLVGFVT